MYTIENTIEIAAPVTRVYKAITTKEGFRGWWTADTDTDANKREATFRFAKQQGVMSVTFRLEREDERGIAMICVAEQNNTDWLGTRLEITLSPTQTGTRVQLVHSGYPARNEVYDMCTKGWQFFLGSLDRYVVTGKGEPHVRSSAAA